MRKRGLMMQTCDHSQVVEKMGKKVGAWLSIYGGD